MKASLLPITGIGSLPFENIDDAIEYSLKFDIPFLPELTKIEDPLKIDNIHDLLSFKSFIEATKSLSIFKTQSFLDTDSNIAKEQIHFIDDPEKKFDFSNKAIHCCNTISREDIRKLNITHLSFDASLIECPHDFLHLLIERGITPVIGVISTHGGKYEVCKNYDLWKPLIKRFLMNCWISPACGLANFSINEVESIYELLRKLQRDLIVSHT